jgi:hypothetical protein
MGGKARRLQMTARSDPRLQEGSPSAGSASPLLQTFSDRYPQLFHRVIHRLVLTLIPSSAQDFDSLIDRQ